MSSRSCSVAVVVPFYQRESGILKQCIISVMVQTAISTCLVEIVIVDDGSPISARDEVGGLEAGDSVKITILEQNNGGPGAARNAALDYILTKKVDYVAFLDSDDIWLPEHLSSAVYFLNRGADAYFCDHCRSGDYDSDFARSPIMREWCGEEANAITAKNATSEQGYRLDATTVQSALVYEYIFQTSNVVCKKEALNGVRFNSALRFSGEDHLFWIDLMERCSHIDFTRCIGAQCGKGVNIYYSSLSWENPLATERYGCQFILFSEIKKRFGKNSAEHQFASREASANLYFYCRLALKHLLRGRLPDCRISRSVVSHLLR